MRTAAAFLAGLLLGAAAAWIARSPGAPLGLARAPDAPALPATPPSPSPTLPAAPATLGVAPSTPSVPSPTPDPAWAPPPADAPLGTQVHSPAPGDSTDAHLLPGSLVPPEAAPAVPSASDLDRLLDRGLILPVAGYDIGRLRDNFAEKRGTRVHEAIDLPAPRGTPVVAVDDGVVQKLFTSVAGGLTIYQFDREGAYAYYYAHLDRYAEGLREGQRVKKGDRLGDVGTTGNAPKHTPHLHFTIFKLAPEKRWWEGTPINPYPLWALRR